MSACRRRRSCSRSMAPGVSPPCARSASPSHGLAPVHERFSTMTDKSTVSRRTALTMLAGSCAAAIAAPLINRGRFQLFAQSAQQYSARAIGLVQRSTVVDMLSVFTLDFPLQDRWVANPESFTDGQFQKFKDSGINVFHPAVGLGGTDAYTTALTWFAGWNGFIAGNDHRLMR